MADDKIPEAGAAEAAQGKDTFPPFPKGEKAIDQIAQNFEVSARYFERQLRAFVEDWAPHQPGLRFEFQMALTQLMVDAMRHKSSALAYGIQVHADSAFEQMALRPLYAIRDKDNG